MEEGSEKSIKVTIVALEEDCTASMFVSEYFWGNGEGISNEYWQQCQMCVYDGYIGSGI